MSYIINIRNLNETQFSINQGITLQKGVYIRDVQGDNIGLKNKYTKKYLVEPAPFTNWRKWPNTSFESAAELSNYLDNNIEKTGTGPASEQEATYYDLILEKLDIIIANQETIISNTAP